MGLVRLVAIIVLTIAFLGAAAVISGVNVLAWLSGGLLAWCVSGSYDYALPIGSIGRRRNPPVQ